MCAGGATVWPCWSTSTLPEILPVGGGWARTGRASNTRAAAITARRIRSSFGGDDDRARDHVVGELRDVVELAVERVLDLGQDPVRQLQVHPERRTPHVRLVDEHVR